MCNLLPSAEKQPQLVAEVVHGVEVVGGAEAEAATGPTQLTVTKMQRPVLCS